VGLIVGVAINAITGKANPAPAPASTASPPSALPPTGNIEGYQGNDPVPALPPSSSPETVDHGPTSGYNPGIIPSKIPGDAKDPDGAKAPGKPGEAEGFRDPKGGEQWVRNPNGRGYGWLDNKGHVWCPTGKDGSAHGDPHWDVQIPGRPQDYYNVRPKRIAKMTLKENKL
jgi:hypothetical protein